MLDDLDSMSFSTGPMSPRPDRLSRAAIGPLWLVPMNRQAHFTGRDQLLQDLYERFRKPTAAGSGATRPTARTQVLVGPAGIGKTQVAVEYAYRHRDEYPLVWWIHAATEATLHVDCAALLREFFPNSPERNPQSTREALRRELAARPGWLLIFDGTSDPGLVTECLPKAHEGHALVTSRNPNWRAVGSVVTVPPMERQESIHLLRERAGRKSESLLAAGQLAKALGDLPLALDQAAALIEQSNIGFDDYLRRFERHWAELLQRGRPTDDRPDTVSMSLELSFRELESASPASAELLHLLSFVAPDGFQKSWLTVAPDLLGDTLGSTVASPAYLDEAVGALMRYSLVDVKGSIISMQPVVGALGRQRLSHDQRTEWAHKALRMMDRAFRFDANDPRTWSASAAMLPHAMAAVEYAQHTDVTIAAAATLLNQVGQCLFKTARYEQARVALDQSLAIAYRIYGEENPRVSAIANNLGRVLLRLGELGGARQSLEWALHLDERTYGATHPHVAEILNNYGLCLARLEEKDLAREQFERALRIYEEKLGPSHPNVASILNNLGYLKMLAGELEGAWEMLQRALGSAHGAYGPNHPDVASILLNLGDVLRLQGSHAAARAQYTRALVIDEIVYGPNHPDVARDVSHLGQLLLEVGDAPAARRHLERALAIDEAVYGGKHPNLIGRLQDLGKCLKAVNEVDAAVECFTRAAALPQNVASKPNSTIAAA